MQPSQGTAANRSGIIPSSGAMGIAPTAIVATADGDMPAAFLEAGDRIVTRRGMGVIRVLVRRRWPADQRPVLVLPGALGGKPHRACLLPPGQRILVRDWRARALWGSDTAAPKVSGLIDGTYVGWACEAPSGLVQLCLGRPEIFYADGLELSSADPVPSGAALEPQP